MENTISISKILREMHAQIDPDIVMEQINTQYMLTCFYIMHYRKIKSNTVVKYY